MDLTNASAIVTGGAGGFGLTKTVLIAPAYAGSASSKSAPSTTRTSTIDLLIRSACSRG
jgi:hypothetical protein